MTDYIPDPFKDYVMKAPKQSDAPKPINALSDEDALDAMGIDWRDDEALKRLSRMKLARIVASCPATPASLPVIRELLDRLEGKPTQRIDQTIKMTSKHVVVELSTDDIMNELAKLSQPPTQHLVSDTKQKELITIEQ